LDKIYGEGSDIFEEFQVKSRMSFQTGGIGFREKQREVVYISFILRQNMSYEGFPVKKIFSLQAS
jgi:hypothetical protein